MVFSPIFTFRYSYLLRYVPETALCKEDTWYSVAWYRTSLLASDDDENSAISSSQEWPSVSITRTSSFKRKLSEGMTFPKYV